MQAEPAKPIVTPDGPSASGSTDPDWRTMIANKWQALGEEILGFTPGPRHRLSDLVSECRTLAVVAAWFESGGIITHAAEVLGTSRRAVRVRLVEWRRDHPLLVPSPPQQRVKPQFLGDEGKPAGPDPKASKRKQEADAQAPASDGGAR